MRVLVTGGAGFIGANTCRELSIRPEVESVIALDDLSTGFVENLAGLPARLVTGSILDRDLLDGLVDRVDAVVHLAARPSVPRSLADPVASHEANATGTLYVLEACRRAGTYVVAASSSSVYGSVAALPKHEDLPTRPMSPYAASKLAAEGQVLAYRSAFGVPTLALRFFNVYGPMQSVGHAYAAVIPAFIDAALRGAPLTVHGDGTQSRDFTYVGSVAQVLADAVIRRVTSETPVNLAYGNRVSLLALIDRLAAVLERPVEVEHVAPRVGDVRESQADHTRLSTLFPTVRPVPLDEGLAATVRWYQELSRYAPAAMA
ncbi:NAD-dependent epimerase/dehydratase family protein [Micromonospora sp. NPDC049559]|uniref:NAD-dependent epimerase/dehydratase family protein n=1 Tax=Micromonospora sp. NPDC049559 TaxID=3155923 RepID=UPI0034187FEA